VLVQRDYLGDGSDYDLLGLYNKRSHFTNFWNRLDIVNSSENYLEPDVTYDPTNNNFMAVHYDSTNGKLPYVINGYDLTTPSTWTTIQPQYNDLTTNLRAAYQRVEINPVVTQAAHAWIAEGVGTRGVAVFDAEYLTASSVNSISGNDALHLLYPNPASSEFTVNFEQTSEIPAVLHVYNSVCAIVETRTGSSFAHGLGNEKFDVSNWANGVYPVTIDNNGHLSSGRIVVAHR